MCLQATVNAVLAKAGTSGRADAVSTNKLTKQGGAAPAADLADEAVPTTVKARKSEKVSLLTAANTRAGISSSLLASAKLKAKGPSICMRCNLPSSVSTLLCLALQAPCLVLPPSLYARLAITKTPLHCNHVHSASRTKQALGLRIAGPSHLQPLS